MDSITSITITIITNIISIINENIDPTTVPAQMFLFCGSHDLK